MECEEKNESTERNDGAVETIKRKRGREKGTEERTVEYVRKRM